MSVDYYVVKPSTRELVFIGTGSYSMYHHELFDVLLACKKEGKSISYAQNKTLDIYDDLGDNSNLTKAQKKKSFFTSTFIPAVYNWIDTRCFMTTDWDFDELLRNAIHDDVYYEKHKDDDGLFDKYFKIVGSAWKEDNGPDSIVNGGCYFHTILADMMCGAKYSMKDHPDQIFSIRDEKLFVNDIQLDVIPVNLFFSKSWFPVR